MLRVNKKAMTAKRAAAVLREWKKRQTLGPAILQKAFSNQLNFITDPSKRKAALCSRRAGKSFAVAMLMTYQAIIAPGCTLLYVTQTQGMARNIMERNIFAPLFRQFNINYKVNHTTGTITLGNGSVIYLLGGDAKKDEWRKFLGQKYMGIVIDEAGSFRNDLESIVDSLTPALADQNGWLALIGTPENKTHYNGSPTLFYAVTSGQKPQWSVHKWSALDNPHIDWQAHINVELRDDPHFQESPHYYRYYLGQWVIDDDAYVYHYQHRINHISQIPENIKPADLTYVLGLDFGWNDDTAFALAAWSDYEKRLYFLHAHKDKKMTDQQIIDYIELLQRTYPISRFITDPASKQLIESIRQRSQIPFESASKTDKAKYIDLMNSDLKTQRIKLLLPECEPLAKEFRELTWLERNGKKIEDPKAANHLSDAALYAWRFSRFYLSEPRAPKPQPLTPAEREEQNYLKEMELHDHQIQAKRRQNFEDWLIEHGSTYE